MIEESPERIEHHYQAMLRSVEAITKAANDDSISEEDRQDKINRNLVYLKKMLTRTYWTDEDMSTINETIEAYQ